MTTRKDLRIRRDMVTRLLNQGLMPTQLIKMGLGTETQIRYDCTHLGIAHKTPEGMTPYGALINAYVNEEDSKIINWLRKHPDIVAIQHFAKALACQDHYARSIAEVIPDPYLELLKELYGESVLFTRVTMSRKTPDADLLIKMVCYKIKIGVSPVPNTPDEMMLLLLHEQANKEYLIHIIFTRPDGAELAAEIDTQLDTLTKKQKQVLRMRYGLDGAPAKKLKEIARVLEITPERARQLEATALRNLRRPSQTALIQSHYETVGELVKELRANKKRVEELEQQIAAQKVTIADISTCAAKNGNTEHKVFQVFSTLNRLVDELELSVRAANCLAGADIVYIGELVQKRETDLLRIKYFGPKPIKEIKDILAELSYRNDVRFTLGMDVMGWKSPRANAG